MANADGNAACNQAIVAEDESELRKKFQVISMQVSDETAVGTKLDNGYRRCAAGSCVRKGGKGCYDETPPRPRPPGLRFLFAARTGASFLLKLVFVRS